MSHDVYADWDAAYLFEALSDQERKEYETHLGHCAQCRIGLAQAAAVAQQLEALDAHDWQDADLGVR